MSKTSRIFSKLKRRFLKNIWVARLVVLGIAILILAVFFTILLRLFNQTSLGKYARPATDFVFASTDNLPKADDRTNLVLLGRGGEGHEAPDLTDTIMFVSISHTTHKATLVSIPRDIWIENLGAKINSAYFWGKQKDQKSGLVLAKATIEEVIGQPVHYAVVIDFSGFKRIIDELGGVTVDVPASFVDNRFPIAGKENDECDGDPNYDCRYETIQFEKGPAFMDGQTALKFVRSRHAEGDNGTDFARAARQQALLQAIKNKVLTPEILFNPEKVNSLVKVGESVIESDIPQDLGGGLARIGFEARDDIKTFTLNEELLDRPPISPRYQNQYVFVPKDGNWNQIHEWVKSVLP